MSDDYLKVVKRQETLPCKLTDDEIALRRQELSIKLAEYERIEDEAKDAAREFGEKKKDIRAAMSLLAKEANTGTTYRLVDVEERSYKGKTDVWRMDSGDLVRSVQTVQMAIPGT